LRAVPRFAGEERRSFAGERILIHHFTTPLRKPDT